MPQGNSDLKNTWVTTRLFSPFWATTRFYVSHSGLPPDYVLFWVTTRYFKLALFCGDHHQVFLTNAVSLRCLWRGSTNNLSGFPLGSPRNYLGGHAASQNGYGGFLPSWPPQPPFLFSGADRCNDWPRYLVS